MPGERGSRGNGAPGRTRWTGALRVVLLVLAAMPAVARADAADDRAARDLGLRTDWNRLQFFDREALSSFVTAWERARTRGLRVVHLGDSHVQAGSGTAALRAGLQRQLGAGGSGLFFPYGAARTYNPAGYDSESTGKWECGNSRSLPPKVPVGVLGIGCRTRQRGASFTVNFREDPPRGLRNLRIFCSRPERRVRLEIATGGRRVVVNVDPGPADAPPFVRVRLPSVGRSLSVRFLGKRGDDDVAFELRGLSLDRGNDAGATVHTAGLGGAQFRAVLHEDHLEAELRALRPDLVIVDYGTNDFLYDDAIRPELERDIRRVIQRLRAAVPDASLVLTSAQDLYRKGQNVRSGPLFSDLVARLAREERCAFWDWFWIAGGPGTLMAWQERGLARKDLVHLTPSGYALKGRLLFQSLKQTVTWLRAHPGTDSLVFDRAALPRAE